MKNLKGLCDGTIEIEGQTVEFTREMLEEHIDVGSWIDYYIGLQVFQMWDNASHNMILYAGSNKSKFYAYFYDLDNSVGGGYNQDILDHPYVSDTEKAMWGKFRDMYKDSIINRYAELRKSVLSNSNIESIYKSYISGIPSEVVAQEVAKWGRGNIYNFEESLEYLKNRLNWLDETGFNLN